jgi:hypothetical protein
MIAKHSIEISGEDIAELIIKQLNLNVRPSSVKINAHCSDSAGMGYGALKLHSITLFWEDGSSREERWDR